MSDRKRHTKNRGAGRLVACEEEGVRLPQSSVSRSESPQPVFLSVKRKEKGFRKRFRREREEEERTGEERKATPREARQLSL